MPILSGGGTPTIVGAPPLLVYDEVGPGTAVSLAPQGDQRNNGSASPFWGTLLGGGHGWASPSGGGGIRARNSNGAGVGAKTDFLDFRLGQNFSTNNPSILVVRQRKFTFECAVTANGNGAEIGVKQDPNTFATANTILGYGLQVAAGNWAGIRRLVTGAGTAAVAVSQAFSAAIWRRLKIEFTEGPAPVLVFTMDNVILFTASGQASMPELTVPFATIYGPAVTAVGGVTILTTAASLRMDYL